MSARSPRILVEDLSPVESLTEQEMAEIQGAGRRKKWEFSGQAMEVLEVRQVMSAVSVAVDTGRETPLAGLTAWVDGPTLIVEGTEVSDKIALRQSGRTITVTSSNANGRFSQSFSARGVTNAKVMGLGGRDLIDLGLDSDTALRIPSEIFGGQGNDELFGGYGTDFLNGDGSRLIQLGSQLGGVQQVLTGDQPTGRLSFVRVGSGDVYTWDSRGSRLFQSNTQLGGVQQLIPATLPGGRSTVLARFGSGDVYAWDGRGSTLFQSRTELGGVRQLMTTTLKGGQTTTLALFASGDVYAWDTRGSQLFQSRAQLGGVKQLMSATLVGGQTTTLALFASGDVYAWDARGSQLFQSTTQAGGVRQLIPGVLPGGMATVFARFGNGDVYAWDNQGSRLHQSGSERGGVQQLLTAIDPATGLETTLVRLGSGDVFSWDARGSRLFQDAAQSGGVQQLISARLPGGDPTTLARFGNGGVYAWDARGARLFQSKTALGGVRQLITAVDPATRQPTTLVRFGSGDVYAWDASGSRLFQSSSQLGGVRELASGLHPQTRLPTTLCKFGTGDIVSWGAAGIQNVTAWKQSIQYVEFPQDTGSKGTNWHVVAGKNFKAVDDRGRTVSMHVTGTGGVYAMEDIAQAIDADTLSGGPARDILFGGYGDDRLTGVLGEDEIDGAWGNDQLYLDLDFDQLLTNRGKTGINPAPYQSGRAGSDTFIVSLDVGSLLDQAVQPFLASARKYTDRLQPIVDFLNREIPVVSDYLDGVTFSSILGNSDLNAFSSAITAINQLEISNLTGGRILLGQFKVNSLSDIQKLSNSSAALDTFAGLPFSVPILQQPSELIRAVLGENVELVSYRLPSLNVDISTTILDTWIPVAGVPVNVTVSGHLQFSAHGTIGYDMAGMKSGNLADGMFAQELALEASFGLDVRGGVDAGLVEIGVGGSITTSFTLDLTDKTDGKLRIDEFIARMQAPPAIKLEWLAYAYVTTYVQVEVKEWYNPFEWHWVVSYEPKEEKISLCDPGSLTILL